MATIGEPNEEEKFIIERLMNVLGKDSGGKDLVNECLHCRLCIHSVCVWNTQIYVCVCVCVFGQEQKNQSRSRRKGRNGPEMIGVDGFQE